MTLILPRRRLWLPFGIKPGPDYGVGTVTLSSTTVGSLTISDAGVGSVTISDTSVGSVTLSDTPGA